jgi:4-hydroxybenzoate polyprenyltransferase
MFKAIRFLSWRHWGLIRYNSVWQNISALFYIGLTQRRADIFFLRDMLLFLTLSLAGTAYGYLVNDLADVELDRRAQKPNVLADTSRGKAILVVAVAALVAILCSLPFLRKPWFLPLWVSWAFVTSFYSLRPIRLKERGAIGLAATAIAQQPLPMAMAFAALGQLPTWGGLAFVLYTALRGASSDIGHQMRDRAGDVAAGAATFAASHGHRIIARLYGASLEMEKIALGAVLVILLRELPAVRFGQTYIAIAWPLLILYIVLLAATVGRAWRQLRGGQWVDPYDESPEGPPRDLLHLIHQLLPGVLLPLYLAMWLTVYYWPSIVFVLGLLGLHGLYSPARWQRTWPGRAMTSLWRRLFDHRKLSEGASR